MNDILILLTTTFPFQKGEEFLLAETEYYRAFEKVYVIPIAATEFSVKKEIGSHIEVLRLKRVSSSNTIRKAIGSVKAFFGPDAKKEIHCLKETGRYSMASVRNALVECYKVNSIKEEVVGLVKDIQAKHNGKHIIVYSYWMANHAKLATEIKKRIPEVKIVTRCHGVDVYEYRQKINYIPFRTDIMEYEDAIFPISQNGKKYIEEMYGEINTPIKVFYLGTERKHERPELRSKEGIHLVSCSYCIPLKRLELIIKALSGIDDLSITWTHIGDGPESENLKRLAEDSIPPNIKVSFVGYLENDKIQEMYSSGYYNLFVNVSKTEGVPVSIMEAMSYGLPVIATDVGGVSEMVEDGKNGFLLPEDFEVEQLKGLIVRLSQMNSRDFCAMSKAAFETWEDKFNARKNFEEFVCCLKEI